MIMLMEIVVYIGLALLGAALGSFGGATLWRLRARQLARDRKDKEPYDHKEFTKLEDLSKTKLSKDRSRCLSCGHVLKWYELIPIVSWVIQRGKCRQCKKPIGAFEILIEVGLAAFFVVSYAFWPFVLDNPLDITRFVLWLVAGATLAILFAYDTKWFLLPDKLTIIVGVLGIGTVVVAAMQSFNPLGTVISAAVSVGILSGLYLVLYLVSRGKWVGFGDIKLGFGLALLLVDWQLALIALFLANFIGCLIVIPLLLGGKLKRSAHVPFGPLLIIGTILAQLFGPAILMFYIGTLI